MVVSVVSLCSWALSLYRCCRRHQWRGTKAATQTIRYPFLSLLIWTIVVLLLPRLLPFLFASTLLCVTALDLFVYVIYTISYACCYFRHCRISLALRENTIHGRLKKMVHGFSFNRPSRVAGWIRCTDQVKRNILILRIWTVEPRRFH